MKFLALLILVAILGCKEKMSVTESCITDSLGHDLCCAKDDMRCHEETYAHVKKESDDFVNAIGKLADELEALADQLPEDPPHGNETGQYL